MRRWLIVGAVGAAVAAGGLALAVANLSRWLTANHDWLTKRAERELGRAVAFDEIGVSLWGGVGVRVTGLRIADDPRYADGDFLRAASAQVTVRILPALFGRYEVRRVILDAPVVTVIRDADGFNVDSLGDRPARPRQKKPADDEPRPERAFPLIVVALLDLRDGELRWVDRRVTPAAETTVRGLHVAAEDLRVGTPVSFEVEARLFDAAEPNLTVKGTVGPVDERPVLDDIAVAASLSLRAVDVAALLHMMPDVAALLPSEVTVAGPITVQGTATGTPKALALEGSADLDAATLGWETDLRKPPDVPCTVTVNGRRDDDVLRFDRVGVRLADMALDASGTVTPGDVLQLDVQVDATAADLARFAALVPAVAGVSGGAEVHAKVTGQLGDDHVPSATGTIALDDVAVRRAEVPVGISELTTTIQLAGDAAVMPPSRFLVAGLPVEAGGTVHDFEAPRVELRVTGEAIPLAVVGLKSEEGLPDDVVRGVVIEGRGRLAGDVPEGEGTIRSSGGVVHGVEYTDLTATMRLHDRIATVDPFSLTTYGGAVRGTGRVELQDPDRPRLVVESTVRGLQLDGLIASQRIKDAQRVSGRVDGDAALSATGLTWDALQRTVAGTARVEVHDGVVHDVNIGDDILGSVTIPGIANLLPEKLRKKRPDLFESGDTRFDTLRASATIARETAHTDDFLLAAKAFTVRGAGSLDADGRVDFGGTFQAARGLTADVIATIREARFITNDEGLLQIPFRLRGTLPKVKAQPDLSIVTEALERGLLSHGLDAVLGTDDKKGGKNKKKGGTEEKIRRGIDRLFGR
ncbi:MAG TPA: AsmA-like C-terminal region-containing protein [Candidatus Binatia bacterium]|jgi:hypothetical protein|nr:AsmA-like C-terminal region-containing protein [Candidatus Binatia bacterium]